MVRFGRELGLRTLVLTLLLMWPLILFGRPAYIADSAAYAKGGKVAVEFVMQKLEPSAAPVLPPAQLPAALANNVRAPSSAGSEIAGIKGARSIAYSVAAFLLRSPGYTLIALVVVQTLLAAFVCVVAAASAGIRSRRDFGLIALAMAAATSLPTFTAFALPDVFAGILVASQTLLFCYYERLSPGV